MAITPDAFLPQLSPSQIGEMTRLLGEIDEFKGHWRRVKELNADKLAELRRVTTIESAASSTRIEGVESLGFRASRVPCWSRSLA